MMKRFLVSLIVIIICFVLQTTVLQVVELAGVVPNLLLIITVSVGYIRGRNEAMAVAVVCGLLTDMMYGEVIGLYTLFYLVTGYLSGLFNRFYYDEDYTIPFVLIGLGDFLFNFLYYIIEFLLRNRLNFFTYLRTIILPEMIYTLLVSFLLYKLMQGINHLMGKFELKEV